MNICIIQTAFLGDLILCASFIESLTSLYPNSFKYLVVKKGLENSFSNEFKFMHNMKLISFDKRGDQKSFINTIKFALTLKNYDLLFCIHNSFRSGLISFLARSNLKIGFKQNPLSFLFNYSYKREGKHEVLKNHKLLNFLNIKINEPDLNKPYNLLPDKYENIYDEYIVIAPGSQWATKKFPKFNEIIKYILDKHNHKIILTGAGQDLLDIKRITQNISSNRLVDLSDKLTISELSSIISNSKLVLCNDSAPLHIAVGTYTPLITFFGPTSKELGYYPLLEKSYVFEVDDLKCRPCGTHGHNKCPLKGSPLYCMNNIKLEEVFLKIDEFLK